MFPVRIRLLMCSPHKDLQFYDNTYGTPGLSYMEIKYYIEYFSHYMPGADPENFSRGGPTLTYNCGSAQI